ncbi:MAG: hemin uptake protein HemP [Burkholderiales bacterium]
MLSTKSLRNQASTVSQYRVSSDILLGPRKELVIVHNGREYQLRLTQNGKLILTASPCGPQS